MDRLGAMSVFVTVVEAGSLSAAGRKLGMPVTTVSRKISELEAHIKTRLLIRSTRTLALTDAGASYLSACKRIIESVDEAERRQRENTVLQPEIWSSLRRSFSGACMSYRSLQSFLRPIRMLMSNWCLMIDLLNLAANRIDLAIRVGELPDSSLIAARVGLIRNLVCASPKYLKEHGTPKTPQELVNHDCINFTFAAVVSPDVWTFRAGKSEMSMKIRSRFVVNTAEAAIDAAIAGVGITRVLSYQVKSATQSGALTTVLTKFESGADADQSHLHRQSLLPLKLRAFLDFATPRFRKTLR